MALVELTLDRPAFKRTEVVEEHGETTGVEDDVDTIEADTGGGRGRYLLVALVLGAALVLSVRALRNR